MKKILNFRKIDKKLVIGSLILAALFSFEIFNFGTTEFSLASFFGAAAVFGAPWSLVLAIAACGTDLAGVASIFTPEKGGDEPWYIWLLGAGWLIASVINAMLTWWAVSVSMPKGLSSDLVTHTELIAYVPLIIAIFVWLTRVSIIGAVIAAGGSFLEGNRSKARKMPPIKRPSPTEAAHQNGHNPLEALSDERASKIALLFYHCGTIMHQKEYDYDI